VAAWAPGPATGVALGSDEPVEAREVEEGRMSEIDVDAVRADDLRYLLAVANSGRLVSAAAALGVDHTTVSRRIRSLERALRARLIERGADGWALTEAGRAVAEHARPVQRAVEEAAMAASGARPDALTGTIRTTAPDGFGVVFVVPALTQVRRQHPDLDIELITATRELRMHQSGFDLAIAVGEPVATKVVTELLAEYALELYASEEYVETRCGPRGRLHRHPVGVPADERLHGDGRGGGRRAADLHPDADLPLPGGQVPLRPADRAVRVRRHRHRLRRQRAGHHLEAGRRPLSAPPPQRVAHHARRGRERRTT
jgi:DNA-binding transcriptional LysR family regulator